MMYCKKCETKKEASDFYAGVSSRCKECHKAAVRENREENSAYYREYDKMRFQRDEHRRESNKARAKTEAGKESTRKSRLRWLSQNPEKRAAHVILGNAVKYGRIIKPETCERCMCRPPRRWLHAHHHDYALPLDVEWICVDCHGIEHFGEAPLPPLKAKVRGRHVKKGNDDAAEANNERTEKRETVEVA